MKGASSLLTASSIRSDSLSSDVYSLAPIFEALGDTLGLMDVLYSLDLCRDSYASPSVKGWFLSHAHAGASSI